MVPVGEMALVVGDVEPLPLTVVVLAPTAVVELEGRLTAWQPDRTGRRYTWPVTCTRSTACCWLRTPGRLTTTVSP